jgi:hypothetical protein
VLWEQTSLTVAFRFDEKLAQVHAQVLDTKSPSGSPQTFHRKPVNSTTAIKQASNWDFK